MVSEFDVAQLIRQISASAAAQTGIEATPRVRHGLVCLVHKTLLGLDEVPIHDIEEQDRGSFNARVLAKVTEGLQKSRPEDCSHLQILVKKMQRCLLLPRPQTALSMDSCATQQLFAFTETQAVLSLLLHLQDAVPRKQMPPSDLFIPHFMPFDLSSSPQPESNPFSEDALLLSSQACGPANAELAYGSKQEVTAWDPAPRADDMASDADQLSRHPFKMLATAVFEQLSDPNLLSSDGNVGLNLLLGPARPVKQQQQAHEPDFGERQSDENRVQSLMVSVLQKPVWMGSNTGPDGTKAKAVLKGKAIGGMPYGLPMALLQMEAEPGSLTGLAHQNLDSDIAIKIPLAASILQEAGRVAHDSAQAFSASSRVVPSTSIASEQQAQGAESLRSSDEFPANKENSQSRFGIRRHTPAGGKPSLPGYNSGEAKVVSEQVLAQEASNALQGVAASVRRLQGGKICTPTVKAASLAGILQAVVTSGRRRQALDHFVVAFGVDSSNRTPPSSDPVLQAFTAAVQSLLRGQTCALQHLPEAVKERRMAEQSHSSMVAGRRTECQRGLPAVTVLEVVLHTERLQAQLLTLSTLCWCEPLPVPDTSTTSQLMSEIIHSRRVTQPHSQASQTPHQQSWGCRWAQEGFPKGPALLSYLYSELQESDSCTLQLVRFLFLAAFQPYMQHMRSWIFSTASVAPHFGTAEGDSAGVGPHVCNKDGLLPQALPQFLLSCQKQFVLAGWQLRVLQRLKPRCRSFVDQIAAIAEAEASEASLLAMDDDGVPGQTASGAPVWGLAEPAGQGRPQSALQPHSFPLIFNSHALQQVTEVRVKASDERMRETDILLADLAEQRQIAQDAVTAEVLHRKQQLHNNREAVRVQKAGESRQRRLHRARLLKDQQKAMSAHQAALEAERALRIREEQEVLEAAARQEHKAALAAAAAAARDAKQDLQQMQMAAQRMAWRTHRWQIAHLRRHALETAEAAEDAELLILASDPALRQTLYPSESSSAEALHSVLGFQLPVHSSSTDTAAVTESESAATALKDIPGFALSSHTATAAAEPSADLAAPTDVATASAQASDAQTSENEVAAISVDVGGDQSAKEEVGSTSQAEGLLTLHSSNSPAARDVNSTATADAAYESTSAGVSTDADGSASTAGDFQGADVGTLAGTKSRESKSPSTATATSTGTAATAAADIVGPVANQQELATAQSAAATAGAGSGTSDRPAAGQYRRVAWAPVHNPFPAAGQLLAAPQQPLSHAHATDSDTHAGARLTQEAEVTQTHSHATAAESATEQNTTAELGTTAEQGTTVLLEVAPFRDQSGTIVAHRSLEGLQNKGEGRKKRAAWKGLVQPFTAAGSSNAESATASTHPAASRLDQPVSQVTQLRLARKRQRWSLLPANDTSADDSPPTSQDLRGVLEQYKCVSKACLGLFKDELRLTDSLRSFQRYFFMDAGDWAEHLTETLCNASEQHGILHEHSVQSMLEGSFKGSSAEHDATAANLRISLQTPPSPGLSHTASPTRSEASLQRDGASPGQPLSRGHSKSVQVDNRSLRALDIVHLSYDLKWPLALVITQEAVQLYSAIFSWLLCLKRVALLMCKLWVDLGSMQQADPAVRSRHQIGVEGVKTQSDVPVAKMQQRLRTVQLFRHEAAHLAGALQAYMQGQLLGKCWQQLQSRVQDDVLDLADLQRVHMLYLSQAQQQCLMSADTREIRAIVQPALQCIVDFADHVRSQGKVLPIVLLDDEQWSLLNKKIQDFQIRSSVLYKVLKYASGRGHYQELFVQLDLNNYYAN
ncbi:hypothetical protein WJX77_002676 [Trebouxia sp. C0004]